MFRKLINTTDDFSLTILRLVFGGSFLRTVRRRLSAGSAALASAHHGLLHPADAHPAPLAFLAICAEFLGGIGLVLGLLGRVAASAFFATCWPPYGWCISSSIFCQLVRHKKGRRYEYHLLAIAIALALMIKGSGALSIDRALSKP